MGETWVALLLAQVPGAPSYADPTNWLAAQLAQLGLAGVAVWWLVNELRAQRKETENVRELWRAELAASRAAWATEIAAVRGEARAAQTHSEELLGAAVSSHMADLKDITNGYRASMDNIARAIAIGRHPHHDDTERLGGGAPAAPRLGAGGDGGASSAAR